MGNIMIQATDITKSFKGTADSNVLSHVSLEIAKGEFVSIVGKSGSGKSTLLYILSTLDTSYDGSLYFDGLKLTGLSIDQLAVFRSSNIGFIFQFHYLLSKFSVLENVMLPALKLGKYSKQEIEHQAYEKLRLLEMESFAHKDSDKLSGGQQQRVSIARALINEPQIIMADEPTGNLDSENTTNVFNIFRQLCDTNKQTIITVTHDNEFARATDRIIEMKDGMIISDKKV